jgi:hypothetical protein
MPGIDTTEVDEPIVIYGDDKVIADVATSVMDVVVLFL